MLITLVRVDLHAARHCVGDVFLCDDARDALRPWDATAAHDYRHDGALAPDPLDVVFALDREIGAGRRE